MERNHVHGTGWRIYEIDDELRIHFISGKPDDVTLARLRRFMTFNHFEWRCAFTPEARRRLIGIAEEAQTWESIGESPDDEDVWGPWWGPLDT